MLFLWLLFCKSVNVKTYSRLLLIFRVHLMPTFSVQQWIT